VSSTAPIQDTPPPYRTVVFDCDSTLSAIEGIDELAREHKHEIVALTERAMRGELALEDVYAKRLALVQPSRAAIEAVGHRYVERALPHARELVRALHARAKRVCIVSGGLAIAVHALSDAFAIARRDVFAVETRHDPDGRYLGFDEHSPLSRSGGKIDVVAAIARATPGPLCLVGDGATDLEAAVHAARFIAFAGVARRENVIARSKIICARADLAALLPLLFTNDEVDSLSADPHHLELVRAARALTAAP
jgi:phosphoserine phosphatase